MNILLINAGLSVKTMYKSFAPPLGVLYIASMLLDRGHNVEVVDCDQEGNYLESIYKTLSMLNPEFIGISCMTATFMSAIGTARFIKSIDSKYKIVLGGIHPHYFPQKILSDYKEVDCVAIGEGEHTIVELVEQQLPLSMIRGLAFRSNGQIVVNEKRTLIDNLDSIPFPARELVDKYEYNFAASLSLKDPRRYFFARKREFTSIITSRGCPFSCTFCANSAFNEGRIRYRSAENVLAEISELVDKGYTKFFFMDDHFTSKPDRAIQICKGLQSLRAQHNIRWLCLGRADNPQDELYRAMKDAGCMQILIGLESGSQSILNYFNKKINLEKVRRTVNCAKKYNIDILASIILGAPCETDETIKETSRFLNSLDIDFLEVNKLAIAPGTEIWRDLEDKHLIDTAVDWNRVLFIHDIYSDLSAKRIRKWALYIKRRFYFRPAYMYRQISRVIKRSLCYLYRESK